MRCENCNKKANTLWIEDKLLCNTCHSDSSGLFAKNDIITETVFYDGEEMVNIHHIVYIIEEE